MEQKAINLKSLTMDELAGVVNLYPWYGAARKELCQRMAGMGGESWGVSQFSDQSSPCTPPMRLPASRILPISSMP